MNKEYIKQKIACIQDLKKTAMVEPSHAIETEIYIAVIQDVKKNINELVKAKEINFGKTLNNTWFTVNGKEAGNG